MFYGQLLVLNFKTVRILKIHKQYLDTLVDEYNAIKPITPIYYTNFQNHLPLKMVLLRCL